MRKTTHTKHMIFNSLSFITLLPPLLLLTLAFIFVSSSVNMNLYFRGQLTELMDGNLNIMARNLDFVFQDILTMSASYSTNADVRLLSSAEGFGANEIISSVEVQKDLSGMVSSSPGIRKAQLYFENSNRVLGNDGMYTDADAYFSDTVQVESVDILQKMRQLTHMEFLAQTTVTENGGQYPVMLLLYPVSEQCRLILFLDAGYFDKLMASSDYEMVRFSLYTQQGVLLKSNHQAGEGDSDGAKNFIHIRRDSEVTSLYYDITVPQQVIDSKIDIIQRYAVLLVALFLAAGAVSFYVLRRKVYTPIRNMVNNIEHLVPKEERKKGSELLKIQQNMDHVFNENHAFRQREFQNSEMLNELRMHRMLQGAASREDVETLDNTCDILGSYVLLAVAVEENGEANTGGLRSGLLEAVQQDFDAVRLYVGEDTICRYLIPCAAQEIEVLCTRLLGIIQDVSGSIFVLSALSGPHTGAMELKIAADEVLELMENRRSGDHRALLRWDQRDGILAEKAGANWVNPLENEGTLTNSLHHGSMEPMRRLLDRIFEAMEQLPFASYRERCSYLLKLLLVTAASSNVGTDYSTRYSDEYYRWIANSYSVQMRRAFLTRAYGEVGEAIRIGGRKETKHRILQYIDRNLSNPITLQSVADQCGISAQYLSSYFKKEMGINFKTYVDTLKMTEAKRKLALTTSSIQDIALSLGFSESKNFIRVFKKYEGMTPGEYREQHSTSSGEE